MNGMGVLRGGGEALFGGVIALVEGFLYFGVVVFKHLEEKSTRVIK